MLFLRVLSASIALVGRSALQQSAFSLSSKAIAKSSRPHVTLLNAANDFHREEEESSNQNEMLRTRRHALMSLLTMSSLPLLASNSLAADESTSEFG